MYFSIFMNGVVKQKPDFTILLPCYNPIDGWAENVVKTTKKIESKLGVTTSLIIVLDGSSLNTSLETLKIIESSGLNTKIIDYKTNKGKGYALRQGVKTAVNFPIIYTDIDFPYTNESFIKIYTELTNGYDAVLGKRDTKYYEKTPWIRKVISKTLRGVLKYFLRLPTNDSQCGIKGFNKKGADVFLETKINRFLFDLEFVKLISKRHLKYKTVMVELKPNIVFSKVNFKILAKESLNFLKVLFRK